MSTRPSPRSPLPPERCNRCRFWKEDIAEREPSDPDWGFGQCRRNPPTLVSSMVAHELPALTYGNHVTMELDTVGAANATIFPATDSANWCGRFEAATMAHSKAEPATSVHADLDEQWAEAERELAAANTHHDTLPVINPRDGDVSPRPDNETLKASIVRLTTAEKRILRLAPTTMAQALLRIELARGESPMVGVDMRDLVSEAKGLLP